MHPMRQEGRDIDIVAASTVSNRQRGIQILVLVCWLPSHQMFINAAPAEQYTA